ncbi:MULTISPECIES: hypothetical protein [unclassified Sinorhizobium]|uniref:hypothetical protein n=1 Tax=unclassified Sinorhizobium TaxID=2613772 RepID=UPI0024C3D2D4|nr:MULTISPECIES: hypothetical protein [unclassified Sinorhizobium]MDK1374655.1 hypothetical protein [Sinorhizobium sp. 6-70]MDK1480729.1 hypothetical protein [Sinorhizobium sp. 6-117]
MIVEIWILCSIVTAVVAALRGGHSLRWLLIGCVLGPIGIIVALLMPSVKSEDKAVAEKRKDEAEEIARPLLESETPTVSAKHDKD